MPPESSTDTLAAVQNGQTAVVTALDGADPVASERLLNLGFAPGERLRVMAAAPGGFPIAVRVGASTFALRRHEASLVHVRTGSED